MSTLHRNITTTIRTVPLEDWFEELSDDALDPLNILIAEEEDLEIEEIISTSNTVQSTITTIPGVTIMSTTTQNKPSFDVKSFLAMAQAIDGIETKNSSKVPCPSWLVIKNDLGCTQANAFFVTAGIVKSTRGIIDALNFTTRQHETAVDNLTMQELRAGRTTCEVHNFGPDMTAVGQQLAFKGACAEDVYDDDADDGEDHGSRSKLSGFNPDGMEYDLALVEAAQIVDKLETVIANGERIIGEIISWIDTHAEELNLEVETGHTVTLGPIGNEIRRARREPLTWQTLLVGIQLQREFIHNTPRK